jgi:hypothetical protein
MERKIEHFLFLPFVLYANARWPLFTSQKNYKLSLIADSQHLCCGRARLLSRRTGPSWNMYPLNIIYSKGQCLVSLCGNYLLEIIVQFQVTPPWGNLAGLLNSLFLVGLWLKNACNLSNAQKKQLWNEILVSTRGTPGHLQSGMTAKKSFLLHILSSVSYTYRTDW